MERSKLSEQVVKRKKGLIISPWMNQLGDIVLLNSWSLERLPEYIWLAFILEENNRIDGISKCIAILREILAFCPEITNAKMSNILQSNESTQKTIFDIIGKHIDRSVSQYI